MDQHKFWLICYLSKGLAFNSKTLIVSEYDYWNKDIQPFELCSNLEIITPQCINTIDRNSYEFVIYDVEKSLEALKEEDTIILTTSSDRKVVSYNKKLFKAYSDSIQENIKDNKNVYLVLNHIYLDSKINEKYIKHQLKGVINSDIQAFTIPFNEMDYITNIENEYDEKIKLKYLSKDYKRTLKEIIKNEVSINKKELKKVFR